MKKFWDERYAQEKYVYGTTPNNFFEQNITKITPNGKLLFPAEGEGRNAVFAAQQGFEVTAFDISKQGREKALLLAKSKSVTLNYKLGKLENLEMEENYYDAVVLIFAHFPPDVRLAYHKKAQQLLKKGGLIVLEAFHKNNLIQKQQYPNIGGPGNQEMLYTKETLAKDFKGMEMVTLSEELVPLAEGDFHKGIGAVVRCIAHKV